MVTRSDVDAFQRDGVVCLRGLFNDWLEVLAAGIDRNMAEPGEFASENTKPGESGRFFDDYCNWPRIPEYRQLVFDSPAPKAAATLMQSGSVQFFHDHVLVKEADTQTATPWHQDAPYYFVGGEQSVSFWIPVDPVGEATLRLIAGSHRWEKMVLPVKWLTDEGFYAGADEFLPVPDPDAEPDRHRVLEWQMQPGDALAFHYRTVHGARGNNNPARRRALSLRYVGDDARYVERPGRTSPPYPGHGMRAGERLREDWFPVIPV